MPEFIFRQFRREGRKKYEQTDGKTEIDKVDFGGADGDGRGTLDVVG